MEHSTGDEADNARKSREGRGEIDADHTVGAGSVGVPTGGDDPDPETEIHQRDIAAGIDVSMARKLFREKMKADDVKRKRAKEAWAKEMSEREGQEQRRGQEEEPELCYVCHDPLPEESRGIIRCGHAFCFKCIHQWTETEASCPTCRAPVAAILKFLTKEEGERDMEMNQAEMEKADEPATPAQKKRGKKRSASRPKTMRPPWYKFIRIHERSPPAMYDTWSPSVPHFQAPAGALYGVQLSVTDEYTVDDASPYLAEAIARLPVGSTGFDEGAGASAGGEDRSNMPGAQVDMMPAGSIASPQVADMRSPPPPVQPAPRQLDYPEDPRLTASYSRSSVRRLHHARARSVRFIREADASAGGGGVPSGSAAGNAGSLGAMAATPAASRSGVTAARAVAAAAPPSRASSSTSASTSPAAATSPPAATADRSVAASSSGRGNNRAGSSSTSTASKRTSRRRRRKDEPVSARSLRFQRETAKALAAQRLARKRHEAQLEAKKTAAAEAPCGSVGCDANSETSNPDSANNDPADSNSARVTGRPTVVGEGTSLLGKHSREYGEDEEEDDERRQGNVEEYGTADEAAPLSNPVSTSLHSDTNMNGLTSSRNDTNSIYPAAGGGNARRKWARPAASDAGARGIPSVVAEMALLPVPSPPFGSRSRVSPSLSSPSLPSPPPNDYPAGALLAETGGLFDGVDGRPSDPRTWTDMLPMSFLPPELFLSRRSTYGAIAVKGSPGGDNVEQHEGGSDTRGSSTKRPREEEEEEEEEETVEEDGSAADGPPSRKKQFRH